MTYGYLFLRYDGLKLIGVITQSTKQDLCFRSAARILHSKLAHVCLLRNSYVCQILQKTVHICIIALYKPQNIRVRGQF